MGFEHNATYKISSVFDGCVLDLKGQNTKKETPILTWDWSEAKNQMWIANGESHGFRLSTLIPANDHLPVLDEAGSSKVIIWPFTGKMNQQWVAKEVPNGSGAVFIVNAKSGKCLRNMGHGNQVKCCPVSVDDRGTWWNITRV